MSGPSQSPIRSGDLDYASALLAAGSIRPHTVFRARVRILTTAGAAGGGRSQPLLTGYRPQLPLSDH